MNVVWEINAISLIAIIAHFAGVVVFIVRASDRAITADKKAEKALETSQANERRLIELSNTERVGADAMKCAHECKEKITILNGAFAAYRESVAQSYVSRDDLRDFEARFEKSIDKLGEHIDRAIDQRGPVRPP
jgi:hypothetical protein